MVPALFGMHNVGAWGENGGLSQREVHQPSEVLPQAPSPPAAFSCERSAEIPWISTGGGEEARNPCSTTSLLHIISVVAVKFHMFRTAAAMCSLQLPVVK